MKRALKKLTPRRSLCNPLRPLQSELDKLMGEFDPWFEPFNFPSERFEDLALAPAIDIVDDKDHFKVEVEMPGMGEDDINVELSDGLLTIKGEKTVSKKNKDKNYLRREISYGRYERQVELPDTVDIDNASASFKKGMLWVNIPKKPDSIKAKRALKIERSA
jgi:HSP20 family protein